VSDLPYILNGPWIQVIREGCGMSRTDLARAMGLAENSQAWIGRIESEQHRPTKQTAERIADALGVFLSDITRHGPSVASWVESIPISGRSHGGGLKARPLEERLAEKSSVDANGCWIWLGRINSAGYGEIKYRERRLKAHRVSYEHHVGPIPDGLDLDHLCRVRPCVNPEHLEPVTRRENIQRSYEARGFKRREAAA
jgi:transcriptional regulator with XRE-family HTH domain